MWTSLFAPAKWQRLFRNLPVFGEGFLITLQVAALALLLALLVGIILGVVSSGPSKILRGIARVYVEFFQNTPLVIQIFFYFNALPYIGIMLPVKTLGVLGVGFYTGAYISEVVRTGILSIPIGQMEAAQSQGFPYLQAMRTIILPQTITIVLPPLTNQAVNLIKNTSILAIIAGGDLMYRADSWANSSLAYGPAYICAGFLYFVLCFPLSTFARHMEEKIKKSQNQRPEPPTVNKPIKEQIRTDEDVSLSGLLRISGMKPTRKEA